MHEQVHYEPGYAEEKFPFCTWIIDPKDSQRVAFRLGTQQEPGFENGYGTLFHLSEEVRSRKKLTEDDPHLILLEAVLKQLVTSVAVLHSHGLSAGLLDPTNVVYYHKEGESFTLALPDVGFTWNNRIGAPRWATVNRWSDIPADVPDFTQLWEFDAQTKEKGRIAAAYTALQNSKNWKAIELRTVARIIAWSLSGHLVQDLPDRTDPAGSEFWRKNDPFPQDKYRKVALWPVLEVCIGAKRSPTHDLKMANLSELVKKLGIRSHFVRDRLPPTKKIPEPPVLDNGVRDTWLSRTSKWVVALILILVLGGIGYFAWEGIGYANLFPEPTPSSVPSPLCPDCAVTTSLYPEIKKLEPDFAHLRETFDGVFKSQLLQSSDGKVKVNKELIDHQFEITENLAAHMEALRKQFAETITPEESACLDHLSDELSRYLKEFDPFLRKGSNLGVVLDRDFAAYVDRLTTIWGQLHPKENGLPDWLNNLQSVVPRSN
ncbi:hypothetical protein [Blastopirellula marina]|uniref:hypothetical protein n=1 Tax=Blastopirellula marina TaxID=124 RepID=UPI0011B07B77|nr:hypothetical protein [Blastopirellula marina]